MLTLHHQADRRERYEALKPFSFDESLNLVCVYDKHLIVAMTLVVWRSVARAIGSLPLRFTLGEMRLRSGDYAFTYPEHARIGLHD